MLSKLKGSLKRPQLKEKEGCHHQKSLKMCCSHVTPLGHFGQTVNKQALGKGDFFIPDVFLSLCVLYGFLGLYIWGFFFCYIFRTVCILKV